MDNLILANMEKINSLAAQYPAFPKETIIENITRGLSQGRSIEECLARAKFSLAVQFGNTTEEFSVEEAGFILHKSPDEVVEKIESGTLAATRYSFAPWVEPLLKETQERKKQEKDSKGKRP